MTDPNTGSRLVTVQTPAGERHLRKITPADWIRLGNTFVASRRDAKRLDLSPDGSPLTAEQRKELEDIDRRPVEYSDVVQFVNTMHGQHAALALSAAHLLPPDPKRSPSETAELVDAELDALGLEPNQWLGVVAQVCNLAIVTEGPSRPLAGAAVVPPDAPPSGPETSTGTPDASAPPSA